MSTYRKEWSCCDSVTETDGWEPESCPFCAPVIAASTATGEPETKHRDIFGICDAYESGIGHGLQRDGHKSGSMFSNAEHGEAYELGYQEGESRAVLSQQPVARTYCYSCDMDVSKPCGAEGCTSSAVAPAPQQAAPLTDAPAAAWMTEDGQRVVPAHTMEGARRDGGAMLSSLKPYTVALVRAGSAASAGDATTEQDAALQELRDWFEGQRKAISKGAGSAWDMLQCSEQIARIDAAMASTGKGKQ